MNAFEESKVSFQKEPQNFLLITFDALRADFLGCYGHKKNVSPNIDDLASKGVLFKQAIANGPNTFSSMPSLLTSTYPFMYGGYDTLSKERVLISEIFAQENFKTAGFHCNPYLASTFGYDRGFIDFKWRFKKKERSFSSFIQNKVLNLFSTNLLHFIDEQITGFRRKIGRLIEKIYGKLGIKHIPEYARAGEITDTAISWLEKLQESDRFFLWIHYLDPHAPYNPPPKYLHKLGYPSFTKEDLATLYHKQLGNDIQGKELHQLKALYQGEIRYMDHEVGRLLQYLGERGFKNNTLMVFTADHGEEFGEHGGLGHKAKLYDELLHVPLIVYYKDLENHIVDKQVELLDIAPTVCDLCNIPLSSSFQGESLLPLLTKEEEANEKIIISEVTPDDIFTSNNIGKSVSIRLQNWKYIYHERKTDELYNLRKDPSEEDNVIDDTKELTQILRKKVLRHRLKEKRSLKRNLKTEIRNIKKDFISHALP